MELSYQHIRNATGILNYAGLKILIDPLLAPKGEYPGFELAKLTANKLKRNPLVDLPIPVEEIIKGVEAVIITHTHLDHWDPCAAKLIPKYIPFFVQHAGDAKLIREAGFADVRVVGVNTPFKGITITKTGGQHGSDAMLSNPALAAIIDESMGFVIKAPGEKIVYFAGDTKWHEYVEIAIKKHEPDYIFLNTGGAEVEGYDGSLIMTSEDIETCYKFSNKGKIVTVHMDAINHCVCTREDVLKFVENNKLGDRVLVPKDGEVIKM